MADFEPLISKAASAYSLSLGVGESRKSCEKLFLSLTQREIGILRRNKDLIDEVHGIAKMSTGELITELKNSYNLDIDVLTPGKLIGESYWIGNERLEDAIPKWFSTAHNGWHKFDENNDFSDWAKNFLLQEIRINLWIRLLEKRKNLAG
jgi:hypothetical protein